MIYKDKLKKLKEENADTQNKIAEYIGIARGRYSHYETEYEIMPIKYLNKICELYDVSFDYLFEFSTKKKYKQSMKEIDIKKSATRLKEIRKDNKLTQEKIAKELNISRTTITEYERATNLIATPFLYTLCKKYNVSADYLLGKIDNPKYLNSTKK